ncbi:MAG TPA: SpoIIE family protein phosphatase [Usitatibacter sp.]|jgi:phosphoserine phosphatase|nr:SpoIIE family protein phosphatase [Usitatibacter sp.]
MPTSGPTEVASRPRASARDLEPILAVAAKLAAPFDLRTMLVEVVEAAKQVLKADRGTVWLYDAAADELVLEIATDIAPVRVPAGTGLVGTCARSRRLINVPDCYADSRFDPSMDKRSGYRTRCMLTLPLVDHRDTLVGVMQVLNKAEGVFQADDESLATVLAAQCAIALQRVRMTEALIEGERMRQELEMARVVQMQTLPSAMPSLPGYEVFGSFEPADLCGGDTFDLALLDQGLLVVLGDATGHGIAPALSVTQMQAMLRMAFRMGADLETAYTHVNNQLASTLPEDRFITAFIGLLDPATHVIRFHSGGQGPILLYEALGGRCSVHKPTSFPLAAMPLTALRPPARLEMKPGDILALVSDGIFEYRNANGEEFGEERVEAVIHANADATMADLSARLLAEVRRFGAGARQEDDMTIVLVKREVWPLAADWTFQRTFDALPELSQFTADVFQSHRIDASILPSLDLVLEELFTNMVKYGKGSHPVRVSLRKCPGGIEATLTDSGVDPFDVTQGPAVNTAAPLHERQAGGLGLHLVRKMVDSIEYEYLKESRQSRIRFRITTREDGNARD